MNFFETLTAAINDVIEHGYDTQARVDYWIEQIRAAAIASLVPEHVLEQSLRDTLSTIYKRLVERGHVFRYVPDVSKFTLERVKPHLRAELDRRIMASANLIRLNRQASIEKTLQRFQGWSTSIPTGGTDAAARVEVKTSIRKALAQLPFEERRVVIDQGHKLTSAINEIVAVDGGRYRGRVALALETGGLQLPGRPQGPRSQGLRHPRLLGDRARAHQQGRRLYR